MTIPLIAAKASAAIQGQGLGGVADSAAGAPSAFADLVQHAFNETIQASKQAEVKMAAHTQGKAELVDVVTAVASAQTSLETAMAVRDQVISAYQEIMRMPI